MSWERRINHPGLNAFRVIRGTDLDVVNIKADLQMKIWNDKWSKKLEQDAAALNKSVKKQVAERRTREAQEQITAIARTLTGKLSNDNRINWDDLTPAAPATAILGLLILCLIILALSSLQAAACRSITGRSKWRGTPRERSPEGAKGAIRSHTKACRLEQRGTVNGRAPCRVGADRKNWPALPLRGNGSSCNTCSSRLRGESMRRRVPAQRNSCDAFTDGHRQATMKTHWHAQAQPNTTTGSPATLSDGDRGRRNPLRRAGLRHRRVAELRVRR